MGGGAGIGDFAAFGKVHDDQEFSTILPDESLATKSSISDVRRARGSNVVPVEVKLGVFGRRRRSEAGCGRTQAEERKSGVGKRCFTVFAGRNRMRKRVGVRAQQVKEVAP